MGEKTSAQLSLVVLCGPTASGKTALALRLAERFPLEIISADSRQVYRGMDIGTAKPTAEERRRVPHHLIDVVDPDDTFNVADFVRLADRAAAEIAARGRLPLVVGGTGLYLQILTSGLVAAPSANPDYRRSLLEQEVQEGPGTLYRRLTEIDPDIATRLQERDLVRIVRALEVFDETGVPLSRLQYQHGFADERFRVLWLGLAPERDELYRRIDQRVDAMVNQGLVEEVRGLLDQGLSKKLQPFKTIGYREIIEFLDGERDFETTVELIKRNTRRYAKRQMTWFRRNSSMIWVDSCEEFARITTLMECFHA